MSDENQKPGGSAEELSDEEALRLLRGDDSATAMDTEAASEQNVSQGSMSDDEARRLLAEMDNPSAAKKEEPKSSMSDDEAKMLLADMDAPSTKKDEPIVAAASAPTEIHEEKHEASQAEDAAEAVEEIPEFGSSEFQNDPDMMKDFSNSTGELMEQLDAKILELEQNPQDKETIEAIFRAAHTLKGAAGMFGFKAIERVMHRMENMFDNIRKGKLIPNSDSVDVVFQGLDLLKTLLEAAKSGKPSGAKTAQIVQALELASKGKKTNLSRNSSSAPSKPKKDAEGGQEAGGATSGGGGKPAAKKEGSASIRVDLDKLDELVNLVGELVIDRTRFSSIDEELRERFPQSSLVSNLTETTQLFGRHMNDVQDIIMKVRMVPIGNAFNKFPRIIRDLARQLEKEMELQIEGETTELDKTIVEQIADPLVHLIRNACDHGVETPDVREAAGKSRAGTIILSARQEGNHILIMIEDDGKGMDVEVIRKKGIEKGLIKESDTLTDKDIFNLIFEAGFSTAQKVTTVSGRGVGMDVVRKQISKLKGIVDIDSKKGRGSKITIQLPLTLAIVQSLLVQSHADRFAIPLSSVVESIRIEPKDIQKIGEAEIIKLRNQVLPLIHLHEVLKLDKRKSDFWYDVDLINKNLEEHNRNQKRRERYFVVVVGSVEKRFGIVVDQLLNQQEMVIKSMGPIMAGTPCTAGGAVMGNGRVVLVLDIAEIYSQHRRSNINHQPAAA